eukprot:TRINITY_DN10798_c0_g1_i8.p1 TRINITY_DN10798_c0_g1~~TRINITY_DN10798_c0_g1_i8.p1  ORF type:complete len:251 (-),score=47.07 TRINITY_DN10798_c0_g1_i8:237-989(-)
MNFSVHVKCKREISTKVVLNISVDPFKLQPMQFDYICTKEQVQSARTVLPISIGTREGAKDIVEDGVVKNAYLKNSEAPNSAISTEIVDQQVAASSFYIFTSDSKEMFQITQVVASYNKDIIKPEISGLDQTNITGLAKQFVVVYNCIEDGGSYLSLRVFFNNTSIEFTVYKSCELETDIEEDEAVSNIEIAIWSILGLITSFYLLKKLAALLRREQRLQTKYDNLNDLPKAEVRLRRVQADTVLQVLNT